MKTPVDAVLAPIAELLMVPPEMVKASVIYASVRVELAATTPPCACKGPVKEPMYAVPEIVRAVDDA